MSKIVELFKEHNIEITPEMEAKFEKFLEVFKETNSQINLSAIRDDEWIIVKHFIDSLKICEYIDLEWNGLDLGTGWGFPGIPLKIIYGDQISMTMVDSVAKKLKCIDVFIEELELGFARTKVWRAEKLGRDGEYREKYDFVVSRAMAYFPTLLEYALPFVKEGGYFIAYKLENPEEIKEWKRALRELWGRIVKTWEYEIDSQKRQLLFIEKTKKIPKQYPRANGIPLQKPLK